MCLYIYTHFTSKSWDKEEGNYPTHLNESDEEEKDVGIFAELLEQELGKEGQKVVLGSAASAKESLNNNNNNATVKVHPHSSMVLLYSVYTHTAAWFYCTLFTPTQQRGFTVLCLHPHSSMVLLYSVYTHTAAWFYCTPYTHTAAWFYCTPYTHTAAWFYCTLFTPTQQHGFTVLCLHPHNVVLLYSVYNFFSLGFGLTCRMEEEFWCHLAAGQLPS